MDLAQVHISVSDIARSVAFYRDVMGFKFLFDVSGQKMAFLQAGPVRIYLGEAETPDNASHPLAYYRVKDLDAEYKRVVAAGAPAGTSPHRVHSDANGELWMASVTDPDGHSVVLMEDRPIS